MKIQFIKSNEKRKITKELNEQFGISSFPHLLIKTGKEKIRGYSGHLSKDEILKLGQLTNIEILGLYMFKKEHDFRLTIDATHVLKDQINNNILEINEQQLDDWLHGKDLAIETETRGTKIIKFQDNFIGSGISNLKKIFNYVPKDRRLKN